MGKEKVELLAFPTSKFDVMNGFIIAGGLSARDYFAAKAMQSLVGGPNWAVEMSAISKRAYQMADAMLAVRDSEGGA